LSTPPHPHPVGLGRTRVVDRGSHEQNWPCQRIRRRDRQDTMTRPGRPRAMRAGDRRHCGAARCVLLLGGEASAAVAPVRASQPSVRSSSTPDTASPEASSSRSASSSVARRRRGFSSARCHPRPGADHDVGMVRCDHGGEGRQRGRPGRWTGPNRELRSITVVSPVERRRLDAGKETNGSCREISPKIKKPPP